METSQGPGLTEVLHDLDDETLRRIFMIAQQLTVNDLPRDEDRPAVEPPLKGGDLRCYNLEGA